MGALKVHVTPELIARSCVKDSRHCMIAEALQLARPDFKNILVDLATVRWTNPRTNKRYVCLTPEPARWALIHFDRGEPVVPFSVNLEPIQSTQLHTKPDGRRRHATRSQTLKVDSKGQPHIDGGQPLPTGHLRGGGSVRKNREASGPELPENASNVVISSRRYRKFGLGLLKE